MSIKLIVIDLDGTLLNEQQHEITPEVHQAIQHAKNSGVYCSCIWAIF